MEHPLVYVTYELASGQLGMFDAEEPKHALKWILQRRGKLASNFAECGAHIRTDPSMPAPNFQLLFGAGFFFEHALMSWDAPAAVIGASFIAPRSRAGCAYARPTHPANPPSR